MGITAYVENSYGIIAFMGSEKQSAASKKQWDQLDIKQRRKRMKPLSDARWSSINKKKRKEHAQKMALARWGKDKKK